MQPWSGFGFFVWVYGLKLCYLSLVADEKKFGHRFLYSLALLVPILSLIPLWHISLHVVSRTRRNCGGCGKTWHFLSASSPCPGCQAQPMGQESAGPT